MPAAPGLPESLTADAAYSWRQLWRSKAFAMGATLAFALGIGVNVAVFSVTDRLLFRAFPYSQPDRLVQFHQAIALTNDGRIYPAMMVAEVAAALQADVHSFSGMAWELGWTDSTIRTPGENPIRLMQVTPNALDVLGVRPVAGRGFVDADLQSSDIPVLLREEVWEARFGRAASAIGDSWGIGRRRYRVVGILPKGFFFPSSRFEDGIDGLSVNPSASRVRPGLVTIAAVARLKDGVALSAAQAEARAVATSHRWQYALLDKEARSGELAKHITLKPLRSGLSIVVGPYLWIITGAAWVLFAAAVLNLTLLFVARYRSRARQTAIRLAIGASRRRIAQGVFVECAIVSAVGVAVALLMCRLAGGWIVTVVPPGLKSLTVSPGDQRVAVLAIVAAFLSGALAAIWPAATTMSVDINRVLHSGTSALPSWRALRIGSGTVGAQAALGTLILVGAAIAVPPFVSFLVRPPGFEPDNLYSVSVNHDFDNPSAAMFATRLASIQRVLDGLPHVDSVASSTSAPFVDNVASAFWNRRARTGSEWAVGRGMFATLRTRFVAGRDFSPDEVRAGASVAIVNETGAAALLPRRAPADIVGEAVPDGTATVTIVGVVRDIRPQPGTTASAAIYRPINSQTLAQSAIPFVVRMQDGFVPDPALITSRLNEVFPKNGVTVESASEAIAPFRDRPRFLALLFGVLALATVVLVASGLYAVSAVEAARDRKSVAIRLALGASAARVRSTLAGQIVVPSFAGIVIGLGLARLMATSLPWSTVEIKSATYPSYAAAGLSMLVVAVIAIWPHVRAAAKLNPMDYFRSGG